MARPRAQSHLRLGRCHAAATCCDRVLEDDPTNVKALYRRAQVAWWCDVQSSAIPHPSVPPPVWCHLAATWLCMCLMWRVPSALGIESSDGCERKGELRGFSPLHAGSARSGAASRLRRRSADCPGAGADQPRSSTTRGTASHHEKAGNRTPVFSSSLAWLSSVRCLDVA